MDEELHIPWDRNSLQELLKKIIPTGETNKIDFKREFNLTDVKQKGEFLKDVSSIVNTYDYNYKNYGFIVFGVENNSLVYCNFPSNQDHLQATIDEIIKEYIGPFINTYLYIFNNEGKTWGVLVIPPARIAPHIFIKDIHKRYKGEIYVRNGTTTAKASPNDYPRFFRQYLEGYNYEVQEKVDELRREIFALNKKMSSLGKTIKSPKKLENNKITTKKELVNPEDELSISNQIDNILSKEENKITKGLIREAKKIVDFLSSNEIPWALYGNDKQNSYTIISKIEDISSEFWTSIIKLLLKDDKSLHEDSLISAIQSIATMWDAPSGVSYTEIGQNIRYYPLVISLYLIFIIGVAKRKDGLLKKIQNIKMRKRSHYEEPSSIMFSLFFIRRASDFFQPFHDGYPKSKWCDAVASYTKSLIDKILIPDDMLWDKNKEFYRGEFILCLTPMNIIEPRTKTPVISTPSSGLYLFFNEANYIITGLLKEEINWVLKIFERPIKDILTDFDRTAQKLAYNGGCFGGGFDGDALKIAFPED